MASVYHEHACVFAKRNSERKSYGRSDYMNMLDIEISRLQSSIKKGKEVIPRVWSFAGMNPQVFL